MKNNIGILILFLVSTLSWAQNAPRKLIHGQVVNDSIMVENVIIFNVNAKTGTVSKTKGYFEISAKENDTLVFSSLMFKSKKVILTKVDLNLTLIKIKLKTFTNQLPELVVEANKNIKPIGNSQAIVDKKYADDEKSSPKNIAMPTTNAIENGVDFVRVYKDILKNLRKNNPQQHDFTSNISFTEGVMKRVNYPFFVNTLKLNDDEIRLFLVFCENDSKAKTVLKSSTDFELLDFLIGKNNEFKNITAASNKNSKK